MDRRISERRGHVVVCGYGRVGRAFAGTRPGTAGTWWWSTGTPNGSGTSVEPVVGDATDDAVLVAAGIERARALVAALDTDADNLCSR